MLIPLKEYPFAARPMIIAHRGDTTMGAAENSLEAIATASICGADMVEVDLQWTRDEVFVCHHDENIDLPDGNPPRPIHTLNFAELASLGAASPAPFEELLDMVKGKLYVNIEVKEYSTRDPRPFMQALEKMLQKHGMQDQVLISSFRIDYIREAGWFIPTVIIRPDEREFQFFASRAHTPFKLSKAIGELLPSELMREARATSYACMLSELTPERLDDIRRNNIHFSVYTISTEAEFTMAIELGATGLVCENPRDFAVLRNHRFHASK